jgi:hypothetical protein
LILFEQGLECCEPQWYEVACYQQSGHTPRALGGELKVIADFGDSWLKPGSDCFRPVRRVHLIAAAGQDDYVNARHSDAPGFSDGQMM